MHVIKTTNTAFVASRILIGVSSSGELQHPHFLTEPAFVQAALNTHVSGVLVPVRFVEVFDENDFVVGLVINQGIDKRSGHEKAEASRPQALFGADLHVCERLTRIVADSGMRKTLWFETGARILYPVQEHPV